MAISLSTKALHFIFAFGFASGLLAEAPGSEPAASPLATPRTPLQAELLSPLDASRAKEGAHLIVRVLGDWRGEDCHLRPGSMIQGQVTQVDRRSKLLKISALHLRFEQADCNNHPSTPFSFTLIALVGPLGSDVSPGQSGVAEGAPLADAPGLGLGTNTGPSRDAPGLLRSASAASALGGYTAGVRQTSNVPSKLVLGQVVDIPKTTLTVGEGADGVSIVSAANRDARLEARTTLVLLPSAVFATHKAGAEPAGLQPLPEQAAVSRAAAGAEHPTAADHATLSLPPAPFVDETEICSGSCNVLSKEALLDAHATAVAASLKLDRLGYAPHAGQRAVSFNHETTLTYLDATHLLCTFDPHQLRTRSNEGTDAIRKVRAILIDTSTHSVERVLEWRVRGDDSYLWRLGRGLVLVRMEHDLRVLNAKLTPLKTIPIDGRVAWVASSPSSDHIAVGVVEQRHSEAVEHELHELAERPEEELEVRVYDDGFNLLSESVRSSMAAPPVLSDAGELRVTPLSHARWKISEYAWNRTEHDLATVKSTCRPQLSAPEHELTFVIGCTATSGDKWYRMLRSDGHPLLRAESPSTEIAQSAEAALTGSFAVRVLITDKPMNIGQPFNRSDVTSEQINVYRTSDGGRLASVTTDDFVLAQHSYALSPGGSQMALVGKDAILFYSVDAR